MTIKQKIMTKNAGLAMVTMVVSALGIGLFDKLTGIDTLFEKVIETGHI